jgi:hypothetical protein
MKGAIAGDPKIIQCNGVTQLPSRNAGTARRADCRLARRDTSWRASQLDTTPQRSTELETESQSVEKARQGRGSVPMLGRLSTQSGHSGFVLGTALHARGRVKTTLRVACAQDLFAQSAACASKGRREHRLQFYCCVVRTASSVVHTGWPRCGPPRSHAKSGRRHYPVGTYPRCK